MVDGVISHIESDEGEVSEIMRNEPTHTTIFFGVYEGSQAEMLRITADGFYVRGVKLEQDEHEARKVWEAFTAWIRETNILK